MSLMTAPGRFYVRDGRNTYEVRLGGREVMESEGGYNFCKKNS